MGGQGSQVENVPERPPEDTAAAARLAFDREVEQRKADLEERKLRHERFNAVARLISTITLGVLVTGGLQLYGVLNQRSERDRSESAQRAQVLVQLANARERALSDLRAQMFNTLLQNYFKQATDRERIAILELIGLNFRDAVQIKPMFELLDASLGVGQGNRNVSKLRRDLRKAAKIVIEDQLNQISQAREGAVCRVRLSRGIDASPECFPMLKLQLLAVDEALVFLRTNVKDGVLLDTTGDGQAFNVRYFDMPMVDSTSVRSSRGNVWRFSIVLYETVPTSGTAELAIALLPVSAVSAQARYAFDELLQTYMTPSE